METSERFLSSKYWNFLSYQDYALTLSAAIVSPDVCLCLSAKPYRCCHFVCHHLLVQAVVACAQLQGPVLLAQCRYREADQGK